MKSTRIFALVFTLCFFLSAAAAQAATVSGTVTDKTTGRPAVGDAVALLDVQAGMAQAATATTDARGHYTLNEPGAGPYLIRVTHQGAGYFIAAPQGGGAGDIPVYDVAAKVPGVAIEAHVIEAEAENGQLKVDERYFVHNDSTPPTTQWSPRSFSIVLPPNATVNDVGAQRPGGLPTSVKLNPDGPKGRYSFNFPIEPSQGEKETIFQVSYTLPYASGQFRFKTEESLPADNVAILLPLSMSLTQGAGARFVSVNADPGVQTLLAKHVAPDQAMDFTISGTGSMPREDQGGGQGGGQAAQGTQGSNQMATGPGSPGGGIGVPIDTPGPLTKYRWWILAALGLMLATTAAFLLRKPRMALAGAGATTGLPVYGGAAGSTSSGAALAGAAVTKNAALLNALKEELFALESDKISGTISPVEYAEAKAALETVLKRALKRS